jgi:nucleotide-binding universal stress UspA family protein
MNDIKTPEHHNVLVPVDFSETSKNAVFFAIEMAKLFNDEITLLHVINDNFFSSIFTSGDHKDLVVDGVNKRMNELAGEVKKVWPEGVINTEVKTGKVFKVIQEVAEERNVDTIVMGTNGASGIEQFIGSTTSRMIRSSQVPVVVVKEKVVKPTFDRIVLPIDLTKESKQKVSWAVKFARVYNSEVHIIMEVEKDDFLEKRVKANLNMVEGIMKREGVKYVSKLLDDRKYPDHIGKDTLQYADEVNADLIMIMTQKEKGFSEVFLGSYAQQLVNECSGVPVLCINPKAVSLSSGTDGFY